MNPPIILSARGLYKGYGDGPARISVLRGLDLDVPAGLVTVVTGRSGAGKTTLLNILGGLDRPDSGRVCLNGEELTSASEARLLQLRRARIGMVFQDSGLIAVLTAAENIEVPLRLARMEPGLREARVRELLSLMGLQQHAGHMPAELSGGQQQRVGIARALAGRPEIILADEPTAQLDMDTAASVMTQISELTRVHNLATVVTTHDPLVVECADRVVRLHH